MIINIEVDDRAWWKLAEAAEAHGLTVRDLIRHGIREVMPRTRPIGNDVIQLIADGASQSEVAAMLGITQSTVSRIIAQRRGDCR